MCLLKCDISDGYHSYHLSPPQWRLWSLVEHCSVMDSTGFFMAKADIGKHLPNLRSRLATDYWTSAQSNKRTNVFHVLFLRQNCHINRE